jgi:glutamate synthase (NADPH/NADH) small chain
MRPPLPDPRGFLQIDRRLGALRPVDERLLDYADVHLPHADGTMREQARRCMGCGVPFCHTGCPLGNLIPDWNDLVHAGDWRAASEALHRTNNFPELTGKLCPAPCEEACVLALEDAPVTIKEIEMAIAERAFDEGWIGPAPCEPTTGRSVGVIGSGPAGLAAAQQLVRAGHAVTVYERHDRPGGLLRYGIPDYKLEKGMLDRRLEQVTAEGVDIRCGVDIGRDVGMDELHERHDAVLVAVGAQRHRDLPLPGRDLRGIELALPYLVQQNRRVAGLPVDAAPISAAGRHVVVIGGGDTSADCLGNALREGALSVTEIAHGAEPPATRTPMATWPEWPRVLRMYPVHEEGGVRRWAWETASFEGRDGHVARLRGGAAGEDEVAADLVLIAVGFTGIDRAELLDLPITAAGTVEVDDALACGEHTWAAGDCVRGADLIVTAIADGRVAARSIDVQLSRLPRPS